MRKDTATIAGTTALLTAAVLGGVYYMAVLQTTPERGAGAQPTWQTLTPGGNASSGVSAETSPSETSKFRTDTPIKCIDPELGEFWTNAASCEGADLNNRISNAQPMTTSPPEDQYSGQDYQPPREEATRSRTDQKPNLRLHAKAPPSNLNVSCKFSVGKALEIERDLAAADDPYQSAWREDYCKWRCEALKERCEVADSYFHFKYRSLCRAEYSNGC